MSIAERQRAIVEELQAFNTWQDRYKHIIQLGRAVPDLDPELRVDKNKVKGCQSQVWVHASLADDGTVALVGDSDAAVVKGLLAIVLRAFSGASPDEIVTAPVTFLDELGLNENLSQTRSNGLAAMLKQVKMYGVVFKALSARPG